MGLKIFLNSFSPRKLITMGVDIIVINFRVSGFQTRDLVYIAVITIKISTNPFFLFIYFFPPKLPYSKNKPSFL